MNEVRIAIPSTLPGGLEAGVGAHFGHCDLYTVVEVKEGRITEVSTLPNVPHQQGGCLTAVNHLAQNGVTVLIAGGMGPGLRRMGQLTENLRNTVIWSRMTPNPGKIS